MRRGTVKPIIRKYRDGRTITDINPATSILSSLLITNNKPSPSPKKPASKKIKMVPEGKKKPHRKRPASPEAKSVVSPLQSDINDPNYFEHRTVNSMADILDPNFETNNDNNEKPRKKIKRRKIEPIDSEVELFKNSKEHRILDFSPKSTSLPSTKEQIALIRETMMRQTDVVDETRLNKEKSKIRKIKKKMATPSIAQSGQSGPGVVHPSPKQSKSKKPSIKAIENKLSSADKYPVLQDQELMNKFLSVAINNNQKGRIRQLLRDSLKGISPELLPDIINNKILAILKSSENLTDTELRKIRLLHNMLKTSIGQQKPITNEIAKEIKKVDHMKEKHKSLNEKKKEKIIKPKRYVVFLGNLPLHVTKEQIMEHFCHISECIKDVRIPKREDKKKSSIAYVELENEPSYQLALSQHHSMLGRKRINVLYTANKNSKMTKAAAKAKGAKLTAMAKKGQLIGSVALNKRRSQRRARLRKALKDAENAQLAQDAVPRPGPGRPRH